MLRLFQALDGDGTYLCFSVQGGRLALLLDPLCWGRVKDESRGELKVKVEIEQKLKVEMMVEMRVEMK